MDVVIWILVLGTVFSVLAYLIRILPPKIGALFFGLAPLLLIIYWQYNPPENLTLFSYLKLYSVCLGAVYIQGLKFTKWVSHLWGRRVGYLILFINVLEPVVFDFLDGDYFNAALGVALLVTLKGEDAIWVDHDSKYKDFEYDLPWSWVLAYTFWDFVFVYNFEGGLYAPGAFIHLGFPLLLAIGNYKKYFQFRAYILSLYMLWFTALPTPPFNLYTPDIFIPWVAHSITAVGFICVAIAVIKTFRFRQR